MKNNDDLIKLTLDYYNKNAEKFCAGTSDADISDHQNLFLTYLPATAHILDLGCGSGRDSRAFLDRGYQVDAIDGSEELCRLASELLGKPVEHRRFQDLDAIGEYDGIWACASILHLNMRDLENVLIKISRALKPGGILYTSFKYGDFEGVRNGRYFNCMTEIRMEVLLKQINCFETEKIWTSYDVRPGREDEKWLNILLRAKNQM